MRWFFVAFLIWVFGIGIVVHSITSKEKDENLTKLTHANGCMTKLEYSGHSYVAWSNGLSKSMVHDPDCKCNSPETK